MGQPWKAVLWIVTGLGGLLALMAQVPFETAQSNLATYAEAANLSAVATALPATADRWATFIGLTAFLLAGVVLFLFKNGSELPTTPHRFVKSRSHSSEVMRSSPLFEANTGGSISAKGAEISPHVPFAIGRAETGGRIIMDGVKFIFESEQPSSAQRDTWMQDAMMYAINRVWPQPGDKLKDGQENLPWQVLQKMREKAGEGRLTIWGRLSPNHLPVPIPPKYWVTNQIDGMTTIFDEKENSKTEPAAFQSQAEVYEGLQVSRSEIEALWPPDSFN